MNRKVKIMVIIILIANLVFGFLNVSNADSVWGEVEVYSKGRCENFISYKGVPVKTTYAVYKNNSLEYPAYCVETYDNGVGDVGTYTVNLSDNLKDMKIWRVIQNGYPYKTPEETGCKNPEEAFTATKQAVHCVIVVRTQNNIVDYSALNEGGNRVLNALSSLLNKAYNETNVKPQNDINIITNQIKWSVDKLNFKYVSKEFYIQTNFQISEYNISLSGDIPEGSIITDNLNNSKTQFKKSECFKVLIPTKELKQNGNFSINVSTNIKTDLVLYGKAPIDTYQDYAITTTGYENVVANLNVEYEKNESKILIIKQDKKSGETLEGVKFNLLDENKNIVLTNIVTNKEGEIILENVTTGKYYLQEVETVDKYILNEDLVEIDLEFNQILKIIVNNIKEEVQIVDAKVEIQPEKTEKIVEVKKIT